MISNEELFTKEDFDGLYNNTLALMKLYCSKWIHYAEFEEKMSLCHLAFTRAIKIFDPERGLKFTTLLGKCIQQEFLRYMRDSSQPKRKAMGLISLDAEAYGENNDLSIADMIADPLDLESEVIKANILDIIKALSPLQRQSIMLKIEGFNQTEISKMLGVNQPEVSRLQQRGREAIKKAIAFKIHENADIEKHNAQNALLEKLDKDFYKTKEIMAELNISYTKAARITKCLDRYPKKGFNKLDIVIAIMNEDLNLAM